MKILGIDPGSGTIGFGLIELAKGKPKLIDAGVIQTKIGDEVPTRLNELYENLCELLDELKPDEASVEKLFFAQNVTTAISVAHARGVAMLTGKQAGMTIEEYTPLQIKQTLTGYGRADKKQMQEMVRLQLALQAIPKPDDAADALATAITCMLMSRQKVA